MCIVMNAGSGKRDVAQTPEQVRSALKNCGIEFDMRVVKSGAEIASTAQQALEDGCRTIVAAGGDGTISAVASVLQGSDATMGILPLGTFNYFARSLDIPVDIPAAVRLLAEGVSRPVRIASINDRIFLNNASLGAYPAILKTREDIYRKWGRSRMAAYWSVLVALATLRKPLHFIIETEDKVLERRTPLIFAVNNAFQLEQVGLEGRDEIAAGRLALFIAPDTDRWGMLGNAVLLALGLAQRNQTFDMIGAKSVRIRDGERSYDVACDGERSKMPAPYDLQVYEEKLSVIVPESRQGDLR